MTGRTQPQHMRALDRANQVRIDAANAKREVSDGRLAIEDAFRDPRAGCLTCERLLSAQRQWGHYRAQQFLFSVGIRPAKQIRSLTLAQRTRIIGELKDPTTIKRIMGR